MASIFKRGNTWWAQWYVREASGKLVKRRVSTKIKVVPKKGETDAEGRAVTQGVLRKTAAATAEIMERREAGAISAAEAVRAVRAVVPRSRAAAEGDAAQGDAGAPARRRRHGGGLGVTWWSVRTYAARYIALRKPQLKRGQEMERRVLRMVELLGPRADMALDDLTQAAVQDAVDVALGHVSAATVDRMLEDFSAMYNRARAERVAEVNPTHGVRISAADRAERQRRDAFTGEELRKILTCREGEWPDFVLATLLLGGQRLGDMANLKWTAWDAERNVIFLRTAKTNRGMTKMVLPMLRELLERRRAAALPGMEFIFPWCAARYGQSGDSSKLSLDFRALLERLGVLDKEAARQRRAMLRARGEGRRAISRLSFHSLRETSVTFLAGCGVPWELVLLIVGIDTAEVARKHYLRPTPEQLAEAMRPMEDFLRGLQKGNG